MPHKNRDNIMGKKRHKYVELFENEDYLICEYEM